MTSKDKTLPMYEIIQNDIIQKIETGFYLEGDRIPSEHKLIETWQVSRTTATKALTELSLNGYIRRIQGKGSFANPLGSHISPGQYIDIGTKTEKKSNAPHRIGIIIPQYYDYHSGNIIRGIMDILKFPSYFVDIAHGANKHEEEYALNYFIQTGHSGIILFPTNFEFYSDIILQMTLNKYPLVLIDRIFPGIHSMSVTCDNAMGCALGISHLVSLGHEGIAFIAGNSYREQITQQRYSSYLSSMQSHGLTGISYEDFFEFPNATPMQTDFLQLISSGNITAAITSNASAAIKLSQICIDADIHIPDQLSVLCFDNPDFHRQPSNNFFTYIDQNSMDMGKQAAVLLHQTLSSPNPTNYPQIVLKPELVVNASTRAINN